MSSQQQQQQQQQTTGSSDTNSSGTLTEEEKIQKDAVELVKGIINPETREDCLYKLGKTREKIPNLVTNQPNKHTKIIFFTITLHYNH